MVLYKNLSTFIDIGPNYKAILSSTHWVANLDLSSVVFVILCAQYYADVRNAVLSISLSELLRLCCRFSFCKKNNKR